MAGDRKIKVTIVSSLNAAGFKDADERAKKLTSTNKQLGESAKKVADSANATGAALGAVGNAVSVVDPQLGGMVSTIGMVTGGVKSLSAALKTILLNPVVLAIGGIVAAFAAAGTALKKASDEAKERIEQAKEAFRFVIDQRIDTRNKEIAKSFREVASAVEDAADRMEHLREIEATRRGNSRAIEDARSERDMRAELRGATTDDARDAIRDRYAREKIYRDAARREEDIRAKADAAANDTTLANAKKELDALRARRSALYQNRADYRDANRFAKAEKEIAANAGEGEEAAKIQEQIGARTQKIEEVSQEIDAIDKKIANIYREAEQAEEKRAAIMEQIAASAEQAANEEEALNDSIAKRAEEAAAKAEEAAKVEQENFKRTAEAELREKERMLQQEQREAMRLDREAAAARERQEQEEFAAKIKNLQALVAEENAERGGAASDVGAADAKLRQAWGWYRDKDSMRAQIEEEKADSAAQQQFEKDFEKLKSRKGRDWREAENLSVDEEAVRRVAIAREEKDAAEKHLQEIEKNTAELASKLDELLTVKG